MSTSRKSYGDFATKTPDYVARWAKNALALPDLLILDTETNGHGPPWDQQPAEIVEMCIIDREGKPLFNSLMQPEGQIHPDAAKKSGITLEMLADAPTFSELADQVTNLLAGKHVVVYNAEFDDQLLIEEFTHCGYAPPPYEVRCAMLAYHAFCGRRSNEKWVSLARACRDEGITIKHAHRALGDCLSTLALLNCMAAQTPANRH